MRFLFLCTTKPSGMTLTMESNDLDLAPCFELFIFLFSLISFPAALISNVCSGSYNIRASSVSTPFLSISA